MYVDMNQRNLLAFWTTIVSLVGHEAYTLLQGVAAQIVAPAGLGKNCTL
jgi:hypothetical protein